VLGDKEFVGGGVLDSLNFAKQDERAPPPKTRSGTVTQAMLAKVRLCVLVCMCKRECVTAKEQERVCVCVCVCAYLCVCVVRDE